MKKNFKLIFLITAICYIAISCGGSDDSSSDNGNNGGNPKPDPNALNITPIEKLNQATSTINSHADVTSRSSLKMNYRTFVELGESSLGVSIPHYPRVKKMANGNYIMFVQNDQHSISCNYTISQNLKVWSPKGKLFTNDKSYYYATTDGVVLSNGDILAVASFRSTTDYKNNPLEAGLVIRRSSNSGTTWSEQVKIYQGVNWEPYLLEVSPGVVHCYFTDSNRTGIQGKDTGTTMIVSKDNGLTWTPSYGSEPYYVIRSKHTIDGKTYFNDQMPSVIKLNGSNELAAALETTGGDNQYNISLAYSGEGGVWKHLAKDEAGPEDRNTKAFSGAAPYLVQFASGETVLSYNSSSKFNMKMGDSKARNFGTSYLPFSSGFWGSMQVMDGHRLIGTMPNTSLKVITLAQFILNHRITATSRSVTVDGSSSEWADTDHALFVGEKSQAQATLRCSFNNDNVYFLVEVLDKSITKEDYATIYLNPVTSDDKLTSDARRIKVAYEGIVSTESYNSSNWTSADLGVTAKAKYENSKNDRSGYVVEISIPRSKLNIKSGQILTNFALYDSDGGEDAISSTTSTSTTKWLPIIGL